MLECYELKENEFPSQVHGHIDKWKNATFAIVLPDIY